MKKRLFAILLALTMAIGLLPAAGFANDGNEVWTEIDQDYINSAVAKPLDDLVLSTGSYRLTENINIDASGAYLLRVGGNVTIDLNGCELKRSIDRSVLCIDEGAELTLMDGSAAQSGIICYEGSSQHKDDAVYVESGAVFNMNGGSIDGGKPGVNNHGTFVMNGGTIQNCMLGVDNYGTMHANGGTIKDCVTDEWGNCSAMENVGTVQADEGKTGTEFRDDVINGSSLSASYNSIISGGRFFGVVYNHRGSSTITGGTFNAVVVNYSDNEITGTFNAGVITGSGTESRPFRISTAEGLKWLSYWVNSVGASVCAVLDNDIDLENEAWTPIGTGDHPYTHIFDGQGHTVSGLSVSGDLKYAGLFGYTKNATVRNLTVSGSVSAFSLSESDKAGGIVGSAEGGTIENCGNLCTVNGSAAGGIAGKTNNVTVTGCYNAGRISGKNNAGGIVGAFSGGNGKIYDCYNIGTVHCSGSAGGITGGDGEYFAYNCYNAANVTNSYGNVYGIGSYATATNCFLLKGTTADSKAAEKSAEEFADGTVLALLKGGTHNGEDPWADECQYVDAMGKVLPVFKWQGATHTHKVVNPSKWESDGTEHWQVCFCGEKINKVPHTGGTADCTQKAVCEVCGAAYGELGAHGFTATVDAKYLKSAATCTEKAVYYKSCAVCGEKGTETFEDGDPLVHDWDKWQSNGDGAHTRVCKRDKTHSETVNCSGGTADCTKKAVCEVCGAEYGELDPNNHTDLKHVTAKEATKSAEGNIEYWFCDGCGKYFADAAASKEIAKADTVKAKLKDDSKAPQTGDMDNPALWIAILLISGGISAGIVVSGKKKKHN